MDYIKPGDVVENMIKTGAAKAGLPVRDLLIRGFLSGALLAFATSLALTATTQTGIPLVGALVFPVGYVIICLLGLELVTGSFALVPLARAEGKISTGTLFSNLAWVFWGNLLGSLVYGALLYVCLTMMGSNAPDAVALKIIAVAEAKTLGYAKFGVAGVIERLINTNLLPSISTIWWDLVPNTLTTTAPNTARRLRLLLFFSL